MTNHMQAAIDEVAGEVCEALAHKRGGKECEVDYIIAESIVKAVSPHLRAAWEQSATDLDLDHLESLANTATDGPWTVGEHFHLVTESDPAYPDELMGSFHRGARFLHRPDAAFVAAARTAVPALIAEVRQLRAQTAGATVTTLENVYEALETQANGSLVLRCTAGGLWAVTEDDDGDVIYRHVFGDDWSEISDFFMTHILPAEIIADTARALDREGME